MWNSQNNPEPPKRKIPLAVSLWSLTGLFMAVGLYVLLHGGWPHVRPIIIVRTVWVTNSMATVRDFDKQFENAVEKLRQARLNNRDSADPWQIPHPITNSIYATNEFTVMYITNNTIFTSNALYSIGGYLTNYYDGR